MKYFVNADSFESLRKLLEDMDLNIDEVIVEEADEETARNFNSEKGYIITEKAPERAARLTRRLLYLMGFKARVRALETKDTLSIEVEGEDLGAVIGSQGKTLQSFQIILNTILNRNAINRKAVVLDICDYRKKREESIKALVKKKVEEVRKTGKKVELNPMPPHERKLVHMLVSEENGVGSYSQGEEPNRRVIIFPSSQADSE
jgi:spoIIIJ-associated protein